ncbi:hypothetical protein QYM36_013916 [Artemia franciscana]|uniref:Uncharacterized protein n=1 Tax=Artemia franciscana TaxID=6661 RepID=A0AA88HFU6_ARTSF|nr:hypothetical protein QYM36_013916 [Artemia franciscana]
MEAPVRLLPVVQTQLDQVADFFARLQQYHDHLEETRSASEKLTKQGRDIQSSTDQITNMEKHILKLEERSKARNDELERVLGKLESFYGLLDKEFCEKLRNSLEETVLEDNTGQGLVQFAAPGVTTTKLEACPLVWIWVTTKAQNLNQKRKKDLEERMQEQVARFDVLSQMADERMQALNTAMSVAK